MTAAAAQTDSAAAVPGGGGRQGLSSAEAHERLRRDGANELPRQERHSRLGLAVDVVEEPMILLLLACGAVYFLLGDPREGIVMLASVLVVIAIELVQTQRSERALAALRDLSSPRARVIRDGRECRIAGRDLVIGDVVLLAEGERVPADGIVVATSHLEVDESLLTGESLPVRKTCGRADETPARPGGEGSPFVYSGTLVVAGRAVVDVTATGPRTELGRIGRSLGTAVETETPLQHQVGLVVKVLGAMSLLLCGLIAVLYGLLRGNWLEGALGGLALSLSLLPEEFPVILTLFLALGAWRIARRNVLVRSMPALEALGSTTVLCVDKTGTLTENRMRVATMSVDGARWTAPDAGAPNLSAPFDHLLECALLASAPNPFDPMERAIAALSATAVDGAARRDAWSLAREYPLSHRLLAMSHVWHAPSGDVRLVAAKGAPEAVVDLCHLADEHRAAIAAQARALASDGLRVLGVATTTVDSAAELPEDQHAFPFAFVGLIGFVDPIRPAAPQAVASCHRAGIRVVMITGDYPQTATAVALRVGIAAQPRIVTGAELDAMNDAELAAVAPSIDVFARVVPEQKLRLVQSLRAAGGVVAMTGDGVNDAPALRAAHIGIAMGGRGTDVAREAADLVLVDDDIASMVDAIRLGRRIFDNIRKSMRYVVSMHVPVAGLSLLPLLFGWPLVLLPLHIVFLELIIDPACSIAFETEPEERDVMERPPRPAREALLGTRSWVVALAQGGLALLVVGGVLAAMVGASYGEDRARMVAFACLIVANLGLILTSRSTSYSGLGVFRAAPGALWAICIAALGALGTIVAAPALRGLFRLAEPSLGDVGIVLGTGMALLVGFELIKRLIGPASEPTLPPARQ